LTKNVIYYPKWYEKKHGPLYDFIQRIVFLPLVFLIKRLHSFGLIIKEKSFYIYTDSRSANIISAINKYGKQQITKLSKEL